MIYIRELLMKPESQSHYLLRITRVRAKMHEYQIDESFYDKMTDDPSDLSILCIGILGDLAALSQDPEPSVETILNLKKNLHFVAYFFDAYLRSELDRNLDPYLIILGASAYYLCDLPGNSLVFANKLNVAEVDIGGEGLENLLLSILQFKLTPPLPTTNYKFG